MATLLFTALGVITVLGVSTSLLVVLIGQAPKIEDCDCRKACAQLTELTPNPNRPAVTVTPPKPAYQKRA